jgi:hypothetical protein
MSTVAHSFCCSASSTETIGNDDFAADVSRQSGQMEREKFDTTKILRRMKSTSFNLIFRRIKGQR